MQSVSIIGIGRVGGALALALPENRYQIANLVARNLETAKLISRGIKSKTNILNEGDYENLRSDIILITTQDSEIRNVVQRLAGFDPKKETFVFHTSGSLSSDILRDLSSAGYRVGSIHPLVSISDPKLGSDRFRDAYFCVEGDDDAAQVAKELVGNLGGKPFSIETKNKALYHASAVTACGHLVALLDTAFRMFSKCGVNEDQSKEILMPLIKSTIRNLEKQVSSEALTGTFDRVDIETFERHLEVMKRELSAEDISVYLKLGMQSLALVNENSTNIERLEEMKLKVRLEESTIKGDVK